MNIQNAKYERTAVKPDQYPVSELPEIAFAGRSNVGKSSIINTLLNRKNLARVGATPGKTREINFYNVDEHLYLVDLPGYGYASVSKSQKSAWGGFIETYLHERPQLRLIILMVDIRHTPSQDDQVMHQWLLDQGHPYLVVASKADKVSRSQIKPRLQEIRTTLGAAPEVPLIAFSAEDRQGRDEIWSQIGKWVQVPE